MSKASKHDAEQVFAALGDRTRLILVSKLGNGDALSATALAHGADVTRQAIVKHLQLLDDVGLVRRHKEGREVLYTLETRRVNEARAFLDAISARWDRAIERLRKHVE